MGSKSGRKEWAQAPESIELASQGLRGLIVSPDVRIRSFFQLLPSEQSTFRSLQLDELDSPRHTARTHTRVFQ